MIKKPEIFKEAKKNADNLIESTKETAMKVLDQNSDGKLNLNDVTTLAGNIGNAATKTANFVKKSAEEQARSMELNNLKPIFNSDLDDALFSLSKFIRITEIDKKRSESEVCKGSIGFYADNKNFRYTNIFFGHIEDFGITLYPDEGYEFYFVDPNDRNRYIALNEYFNYLKVARINELQKIAQDLGATHFRVTYKEEKSTFTNKNKNSHLDVTGKLPRNKAKDNLSLLENNGESEIQDNNVEIHATREKEYILNQSAEAHIAAEMDFGGHAPIKPTLHYLKREPSIQGLIAMRLDEKSTISHQKLMIQLNSSTGIKENDAIKIDAVLKSLKMQGNTTLESEVKSESRKYLEYEIDF